MTKSNASFTEADHLGAGRSDRDKTGSRPLRVPGPPPLILLAGPTGVGKTELALELARRIPVEVVNADSMQIYRFMDIGTAKPTAAERRRVPHHLFDIVEPDETFDAARYQAMACPVVDALRSLGVVPLVVGGTGLYMKVLLRGLCAGAPGDPQVKKDLRGQLARHGLAPLYARLQRIDPGAAAKIHPHDRQRILRALEVYQVTSQPLSTWQQQHRFQQIRYPSLNIFLYRDRQDLYRRIDRRVRQMMDRGLLDEVKRLLDAGYSPDLKSMQSLGYRHLASYLAGAGGSLDDTVKVIQRDTRRYAKRQLTWFRSDPTFQWFHADERDHVLRRVTETLAGAR